MDAGCFAASLADERDGPALGFLAAFLAWVEVELVAVEEVEGALFFTAAGGAALATTAGDWTGADFRVGLLPPGRNGGFFWSCSRCLAFASSRCFFHSTSLSALLMAGFPFLTTSCSALKNKNSTHQGIV